MPWTGLKTKRLWDDGNIGYRFYGRDPVAPDFDQTTLNMEYDWHDLDLSTIIPIGTKMVYIQVSIVMPHAGQAFDLRKKGNIGTVQQYMVAQVDNVEQAQIFLVEVDTTGLIEYRPSGGEEAFVYIWVFGWWK